MNPGPATDISHIAEGVLVDLRDSGALLVDRDVAGLASGDDIDAISTRRMRDRMASRLADKGYPPFRLYRYGAAGTRADVAVAEGFLGIDVAWAVATRTVRVVGLGAFTALGDAGDGGVSSPACRLAYALAKSVVKGRLAGGLSTRTLSEWSSGLTPSQVTMLESLYGARSLERFRDCIDDQRLDAVIRSRRSMMLLRRAARDPLGVVYCLIGSAGTAVDRLRRPPGVVVAVTGPDGSGKSTLIDALMPTLQHLFRGVDRHHLTAGVLPRRVKGPQTVPHARAPYGTLLSCVKLCYLLANAWMGWMVRVLPALLGNRCVLFDRYVDDFVVDPARYRLRLPATVLDAAARLVPQPTIRLILAGDAAVLAARKNELSEHETRRQIASYSTAFPVGILLDCEKDVGAMADESVRGLLAAMRGRFR